MSGLFDFLTKKPIISSNPDKLAFWAFRTTYMKKNTYEPPPITPETTSENARKWLSIIRYRESGTVIQLQDDCEYRVLEIINNKDILKAHLGPYYKKHLLAFIPIDQKDLHATIKETILMLCEQKHIELPRNKAGLDLQALLDAISQQGFEVGLFITHLSHLLHKKTMQSMIDLEHTVRATKNLSVIVFTHTDITNTSFQHLTDSCSFLFDHVLKYPLYGDTDTLQFCNWVTHTWDTEIPNHVISEIIHTCGGYLWLVNQALRTYRDNPEMGVNHAVSTDTILTITESIWNRLSDREKDIVRKLHFGSLKQEDTLTQEFGHLKSLHVIGDAGKTKTLRMPIFSPVIERESHAQVLQPILDKIFIGKKDITEFFTGKEKVFIMTLLASRKKIVPRDVLALKLWGNAWEEKYSDWAIDRLAFRLRTKLRKLGMNSTLIHVIKRKGFLLG